MTILTSFVSKSTLLKYAFGYSFSISSMSFIEQEFTNNDFFTNILEAVPSKVTIALGIVYGVVILFGRISKEWKNHKLNIQEVKKGKEHLEQEEIKTDKQRKEL